LSRAQIEKQLDASLKRLQTDYVDLYQCHRYDDETPLEETMQALTDAVQSGKVRYLGFSEWPADKIQAALDLTGVEQFVSSQPAIFTDLARAGRACDPALRRQWHRPDRLVAAGAGRVDG
jgi:aryl-alcohol dehydrogenase-like predicted oxidoreductase